MRVERALLCLSFFVINYLPGHAQTTRKERLDNTPFQPVSVSKHLMPPAVQQISPAMKASFDQIIDSCFKPDEPGGTVLIAQKGKVLYERSFGMANLELNVKMQPDMLFEIGSQTKQFTAICILQLMEQGKLAITDPISNYFENSPLAWQQITIGNLMTHSSGISDLKEQRNISVAAMIDTVKKRALAYPPGTKTFYANIEFVLLGAIVEKVSGQTYGDYLKEHIISPLGMKHTYYADNYNVIPNRAPAYLKRSTGFTNAITSISVSGAGALISNTYDMLTWYEALVAGKVVKKETLDRAWKPYVLANGKPSKFGYGWMIGGAVQGSPIIEHSGLAIGYSTEAFYMPKEQVFVAVFLNQRGYPDPLAQNLAAILIGKPYPTKSIQAPEQILQACSGTYETEEGGTRSLTFNDGKLYYIPKGVPKIQMTFYDTDKFYFNNTLMMGAIRRDAQGRITALELFDKRYLSSPGMFWKKIE